MLVITQQLNSIIFKIVFCFRTRWHMNPYIRGAYSYRTAPFEPKLLDPLGPTIDEETVKHYIFIDLENLNTFIIVVVN